MLTSDTNYGVPNTGYVNKDFQTIYQELLSLAKELSYRWDPTISDESDPMVVLLKLNALIADKCNYNIDKNVLETFPQTVTQPENARQLFDQLGYSMGWYYSAVTTLTAKWTADIIRDETSDEYNLGNYYIIPRFTCFCNEDKTVVYSSVVDTTLTVDGSFTYIPVMQGVPTELSVNGDTTITYSSLDSNNRVYFPNIDVAENGIFINILGKDDYSEWIRVDNLEVMPLGSKIYKFGVDRRLKNCYIEFPSDIANILENGINITYFKTSGYGGNIGANIIVQSLSDLLCNGYDANGNEIEQKLLDETNISISNPQPVLNGKNPEEISDAFRNYQKTVGTFNTLVSIRDYINYFIREGYISNGFVCDRMNDIQTAYKVMTLDKGVNYKITEWEKQDRSPLDINNDGVINKKDSLALKKYLAGMDIDEDTIKYKLQPFELKLYALQRVDDVNDIQTYASSFEVLPYYDTSDECYQERDILNPNYGFSYSEDDGNVNNIKLACHDFVTQEIDRILLLKNKYPLDIKIIPQYALSSTQIQEVKGNIVTALCKYLNSQKLEFGESPEYNFVKTVIQYADSRIKEVILDSINYYTFAGYYEESYQDVKVNDETVQKVIHTYKEVCISDETPYIVGKLDAQNNKFYALGDATKEIRVPTGEYCLDIQHTQENGKWVYSQNVYIRKPEGFELYSDKRLPFRHEVYAKAILNGNTPIYLSSNEFLQSVGQGLSVGYNYVKALRPRTNVVVANKYSWESQSVQWTDENTPLEITLTKNRMYVPGTLYIPIRVNYATVTINVQATEIVEGSTQTVQIPVVCKKFICNGDSTISVGEPVRVDGTLVKYEDDIFGFVENSRQQTNTDDQTTLTQMGQDALSARDMMSTFEVGQKTEGTYDLQGTVTEIAFNCGEQFDDIYVFDDGKVSYKDMELPETSGDVSTTETKVTFTGSLRSVILNEVGDTKYDMDSGNYITYLKNKNTPEISMRVSLPEKFYSVPGQEITICYKQSVAGKNIVSTIQDNDNVTICRPNANEITKYSSCKVIHFKEDPTGNNGCLYTLSTGISIGINTYHHLQAGEYISFLWREENSSQYNFRTYRKESGTNNNANQDPIIYSNSGLQSEQTISPSTTQISELNNGTLFKILVNGSSEYTSKIPIKDATYNYNGATKIATLNDYITDALSNTNFTLSNDAYMSICNITEIKISEFSSNYYWILNEKETQEDGNQYYVLFEEGQTKVTLKSNEYFFYYDSRGRNLYSVGYGTTIIRDNADDKWEVAAYSYQDVIEQANVNLSTILKRNTGNVSVSVIENNIASIGAGTSLQINSQQQDELNSLLFAVFENDGCVICGLNQTPTADGTDDEEEEDSSEPTAPTQESEDEQSEQEETFIYELVPVNIMDTYIYVDGELVQQSSLYRDTEGESTSEDESQDNEEAQKEKEYLLEKYETVAFSQLAVELSSKSNFKLRWNQSIGIDYLNNDETEELKTEVFGNARPFQSIYDVSDDSWSDTSVMCNIPISTVGQTYIETELIDSSGDTSYGKILSCKNYTNNISSSDDTNVVPTLYTNGYVELQVTKYKSVDEKIKIPTNISWNIDEMNTSSEDNDFYIYGVSVQGIPDDVYMIDGEVLDESLNNVVIVAPSIQDYIKRLYNGSTSTIPETVLYKDGYAYCVLTKGHTELEIKVVGLQGKSITIQITPLCPVSTPEFYDTDDNYNSVIEKVAQLDVQNAYDYLYNIPDSDFIKNPLDGQSFALSSHPYNKFTISQIYSIGAQVMNPKKR